MWRLVGFLIVFFIPITFHDAAYAKEYEVKVRLTSTPVAIFSVNPPKILEKKFVSDDPLQSFLSLELSGTFEGNLCTGNDVAFELEPSSDSKYPREVFNLYLKTIQTNSDSILLNFSFCALYSSLATFKSTMKVQVNMWGPPTQERVWQYKIRTGFVTIKLLTVKLNARSGWTVDFADP